MTSSSARTRKMNEIVSRMKDSITDSEILEKFMHSESAGERLVAIAFLQKFPKIKYLGWLADHVGDGEKPFVGYQASVAIYLASRAYGNHS